MQDLTTKALDYHKNPQPGKIGTTITKSMQNEADLTLAYSPGVAEPVMAIAKDPGLVYDYTAKGNLVAVISNGTAILGLGNQGPLAAKPVMEGKAALFKKFANIDSIDIEINSTDPQDIIKTIIDISPTFGGINLEDIKAPECFIVEQELQKHLNIPVFHDDQHGTAITVAAALINATKLQKKSIKDLKIVIQGAGASALACANFLLNLDINKTNIIMLDSKGVISDKRQDLNIYKQNFAHQTTAKDLITATKKADVFIDLAGAKVTNPEVILDNLSPNPIVFTLSNPTPCIDYNLIKANRPDSIIATGLSNLPNQVNNVVCFPYIFKGALLAKAPQITTKMQIAATYAIAGIVNEPYTQIESLNQTLNKDYILPKPYDPRLLKAVTTAVKAAYQEQ